MSKNDKSCQGLKRWLPIRNILNKLQSETKSIIEKPIKTLAHATSMIHAKKGEEAVTIILSEGIYALN